MGYAVAALSAVLKKSLTEEENRKIRAFLNCSMIERQNALTINLKLLLALFFATE